MATATKDAPVKISRITRNSKLFKTIVNAIHNKKGENVVSLDLKKITEAVSDYFIICEADNSTQVKAIADNVEFEVKNILGELPYKKEGHQGLQWILLDYVDVVVHVFLAENRKYYRLEDMWSDAGVVEHTL